MLTMRIILLPIIFLVVQSCSPKKKDQDDWDKDNIISLAVDEPAVKRAMKAAQDSLVYYIDYFKRFYGEENYLFFLKSKFEDGAEAEHMWSRPIEINETGFRSILDNEPNDLKNYKFGDTIQIDFGKIEDYIIITADTIKISNYLEKELGEN